jgi:hypothetical protein
LTSIAERLYRILLFAYPRKFRSIYGPLMLRHFKDTNTGKLRIWIWILGDTVASSAREHRAEWRKQMSKMALIAAGILVLPLGFVLINVLQYELGIPIPWNLYDSVYDQISGTSWTHLFDAVILLSPIAAVTLVVMSQIRISGGDDKAMISRIEIRKVSRLAYIVVGTSAALLGVMGLYVVFENLPCLLGQQVIC